MKLYRLVRPRQLNLLEEHESRRIRRLETVLGEKRAAAEVISSQRRLENMDD